MTRHLHLIALSMLAVLLGQVAAQAKITPAQTCETAKLAATKRRLACLLSARQAAVRTGEAQDLAKCSQAFVTSFQKAEAKGGFACPSIFDAPAIAGQIDTVVTQLSGQLAGTDGPPVPGPGLVSRAQYPRGHRFSGPSGVPSDTSAARHVVMPFDLTNSNDSRQIVARIVSDQSDPLATAMVATHWRYWSDDGRALADVFICLTPGDNVVVDPSKLQGQTQVGSSNVGLGPVFDLTGERGLVTVTAMIADPGDPNGCTPGVPATFADSQLVGSWVIANRLDDTSFGQNAIGIGDRLPDPEILNDPDGPGAGLVLQSFNPWLFREPCG